MASDNTVGLKASDGKPSFEIESTSVRGKGSEAC
jgi:hypothetical protein